VDKVPTLIVYWADTREPLTYAERQAIETSEVLVLGMTPLEVLVQLAGGRRVVIRGLTDLAAPAAPAPRN
jgi:hypothetical protein